MAVYKREITISVIISTYNHPEWLQKVLFGYEAQTFKKFEIIIADDGSGEETKALIEKFSVDSLIPVIHVWHEDKGFRKSEILNKAILASTADYLIFSEGDCIPKADLVEIHENKRKEGSFIVGGCFMLPMLTSEIITKENICKQQVFSKNWLCANGVLKTFKMIKLSSPGYFARFMNFIIPAKTSWNGRNASGWKADIIKINGFDERIQYGEEGCEFGERLANSGIKPIHASYSALVVHLKHKEISKTKESSEINKAIRETTQTEKAVFTPYGMRKENEN